MRNWNKIVLLKILLSLVLRAYLWGIETPFWRPPQIQVFWGWEPTYEELKLLVLVYGFWCYHSWEPTYEELKRPQDQLSVKILYSWEPTYEELKLYSFAGLRKTPALRAYLWGIETVFNDNVVYTWRSWEPTYEELKRNGFGNIHILWPHRVESLPMRNWNIQTLCLQELDFQVESLPMRNWNLVFNFFFIVFLQVESLPMRNWN